MSDPLAALDLARCEELARRAADGDAASAKTLVELVWPSLGKIVRAHKSMGPLARSEDSVHDVLATLVEKLGADDARALKLYVTWRHRHADKTLFDWIRIVTKNAIRDHVREQLGETRGGSVGGDPSVKRVLNDLAASPAWERLGVRPPMTAAQTARQLLEFAATRLPEDQCRALAKWLDGADFAEMRAELALASEDDARRLLRAAIAALRRYFVEGGG